MFIRTKTLSWAAAGVVLAGVYATTLMFTWPLLAASILGLADTVLNIRGRIAHKRGPPNLPT